MFRYLNAFQIVVISNYSNWCHDSLCTILQNFTHLTHLLQINIFILNTIKKWPLVIKWTLGITFKTSLSLEHYMNKWQAGCLQNLLISHQLTTKYFYNQLLVPINIPSYDTFKLSYSSQNQWVYLYDDFVMSLFMIHHQSSELDFRCKLVLIQCNNRSVAHSLK